MNIFYIDEDPTQAAQWMVDKHVVKMILESAQLLSTAHRLLDGVEYVGTTATGRKAKRWKLEDARETIIYSATHINHPSAVWARTSVENYQWLVDHFFALMKEYTYRYGKTHACYGDLSYALASPPMNLKAWDKTPIIPAMADEFIISDDPVTNYRNYYRNGKKHLFAWTNREPPVWLNTIDT